MKALILSAGEEVHLAPISTNAPKALLPIGSQTILERLLDQLGHLDIDEVVVVVGYEGSQVIDHVCHLPNKPKVTFVENKNFIQTRTGFSVQSASKYLKGYPFYLIDGDTVLSDRVIQQLKACPSSALFYEKKGVFSPEEIKIGYDLEQKGFILSKNRAELKPFGEFIGVAKFDANTSDAFFAALELVIQNQPKAYYEDAITRMSRTFSLELVTVASGDWIEVDFVIDYMQAIRMFASSDVTTKISEQILLCPGPVMVSSRIKKALMHSDIGHRESEFVEVLTRVRQKLNLVFGVSSTEYTNVVLTGSGTAANESLISSYGPGKKIVVVTNGEFGNRLLDISKCHGIDVLPIDFGWGNPINLSVIGKYVESQHIDALMMVHHETSTGMLNPIHEVGQLLEHYGVDFLVDAVSSLGSEPLSMEGDKITFCTSSSNKCIAALPGLSFVCGKKSAFEALNTDQSRTHYLDLYRCYAFEELNHQTPNTPAVSLFFALEAALDELLSETVTKRRERYGDLASLIRVRLKDLGMKFVIPEYQMSCVLTTVYYPNGTDIETFHSWIKNHNYVVYRGKGPYLESAFQIANIGQVTKYHILSFLELIERSLREKCLKRG